MIVRSRNTIKIFSSNNIGPALDQSLVCWVIRNLNHTGPLFWYKLRYNVGFGLVEMVISTNPKPTLGYIVNCTRTRATHYDWKCKITNVLYSTRVFIATGLCLGNRPLHGIPLYYMVIWLVSRGLYHWSLFTTFGIL